MRVLMVEDNQLNRELATDLLELDGHTVELAVDAAALRRCLGQGQVPDVVLMDIQLPDGDGVSLLGELRARGELSRVPVVALTAHAGGADIERLRGAGFDAVVTKPIDTRTFVQGVLALATAGRGG